MSTVDPRSGLGFGSRLHSGAGVGRSGTDPPRTRRVLQVITPSRMAGAETLLTRMAARLSARGHELKTVVNRGSAGVEPLRQAGLNIEELPIGGKVNLRAVPALAVAAGRFQADLLHSHLSSASWWCGWLERLGGPPSLGHVHGFTSAYWHRGQTHLVACSQAVKDHLVAQRIPATQITVLLNPVDPADVQPRRAVAEVRDEFGATATTPVVGCFAHFSEKKGWRDLLAAAPQVLHTLPDTQFWCVGDGPLRGELAAAARAMGIEGQMRFPGFRRDVADLMQAVDVMALPSHREPFGLVYVEAALLERPVIACNAGGAPEVIAQGETGLLVPPQSPNDLATAILTLLEDRALAARFGQRGREQALDRFTWDRYLRGLEALYDRVAR